MQRQTLSPAVERTLVAGCFLAVTLLALCACIDWLQGNIWCDADVVGFSPPAFLVDLQTAGEAELGLLPDVGPQLARRIVEARQQGAVFRSAEDLRTVRGIGPKRQQAIEPFIAKSTSDDRRSAATQAVTADRQTKRPAPRVAIPVP